MEAEWTEEIENNSSKCPWTQSPHLILWYLSLEVHEIE